MSSPFFYVGGLNWNYYYNNSPSPGQPTVHVFDRAINLISSFATEGHVVAIAIDSDGCIYLNQNPTWNPDHQTSTTCKYTLWGDLIWKATHGAERDAVLGRLVLDSSNNVYTVGIHVDANGAVLNPGDTGYPGLTTRKYSGSGALQWAISHGASRSINYDKAPIAVSGDGSLIVTGMQAEVSGSTTSHQSIQAFDSNGDSVWSYGNYYNTESGYLRECLALAIDADKNVYAGAGSGASHRLYKFNSSGTVLATSDVIPLFDGFSGIQIDSAGALLVLCRSTSVNGACLYKFDSDLNLVWTSSSIGGWNYSDIDLDADNRIYLSNSYFPSGFLTYTPITQTVVLGADGSNDFTVPYLNSDTNNFCGYPKYCIAVREPISVPPLPLRLNLAAPTWQGDRYVNVPSIAIPLALSTPRFWRDHIDAKKLSDSYHLVLSGSPDLELPISSVNCRQDTETITVSVIVPGLTVARVEAVESRIDGELIVYRGIRWSAATEQKDEMWRVPLDSVRYDFGTGSGSLVLQGTTINEIGGNTRRITGISYRNAIGSNRRIRCAIDTYLRPGDTADLGGGETMIVAEIVYYIGIDRAFMEIAE